MSIKLEGLRTVIYPAPNVELAKEWWSNFLGISPYFDRPFYVGYDVGGYELALMPTADPTNGALVYWGVSDVPEAVEAAIKTGSIEHIAAADVGDGIVTATVRTPGGMILGLISNPNFNPA